MSDQPANPTSPASRGDAVRAEQATASPVGGQAPGPAPEGATVTLVILGASGDLTKRLLLPGIGTLLSVETDRRLTIVGADRAQMSDDDWKGVIRTAFDGQGVPAGTTERVISDARYVQADLLDAGQVKALIEPLPGPVVLYFALPPAVTIRLCALLEQVELPQPTRLALEKPFGTDRQTAHELNQQLLRLVPEDHIHRVDHFLGVGTVLNIIGLRFANRLLLQTWDAENIERVEILYDEEIALEGRAGYYDHNGALKDMIQSHLLQVMGFVAMEPPAAVDAQELRDLQAHVLRATRIWGGDPATASRRARYTAGEVEGRQIPSYVDEEGVDPANMTETLAQVTVEINTNRWAGVPFILRSGKALGVARKEVAVHFKPVPHLPEGLVGHGCAHVVTIPLKPGPMRLDLTMNAEGDPFDLEQKTLEAQVGDPQMLPYGEVLGGILDGDPLLTVRGDVAEDSWRIVEEVISAWQAGGVPMEEYAVGSAGPQGWDEVPERA